MSAVPKQPELADSITDPRQVDLSALITVSKADNLRSMQWGNHQLAIQELINWVDKLRVGDKAQGLVWAPATLTGKRRLASNAEGTDLAVFDSDAGHTLDELKTAFERTGWYARIIPSSSWGKTETEGNADHYDAWVAAQTDKENLPERYLIERYLIEQRHMTETVAKGATEIKQYSRTVTQKDGGKDTRNLILFRHQPCEKYRIICVLAQRYDLSTPQARRAWKKHYYAMIDVVGLPLDRSTGSPERLFYLSYLSPDRLKLAGSHQAEIEGGPIDVAALPAPKPCERTRRGRVRTGRDHDHDHDGGGTDGGFIWTDPDRTWDLKVWAAKGGMRHLELADALLDNGWTQDDRGVVDGKHHIECPFNAEHTSQFDGGTIAWNASDHRKTGMTDLQPGAGIYWGRKAQLCGIVR